MKLLKTPEGLMMFIKVSFAMCSVEQADKSPLGEASGIPERFLPRQFSAIY